MRRLLPAIPPLLAAAAVLGALGGGAQDRALAASPSLPANIVVLGHGFGHGRGMGQYGAYGYALTGESYSWILGHYYGGTVMGTVSTSTVVRVQLTELNGQSSVEVRDSKGTHVVKAGQAAFVPAGGVAWVMGPWPEGTWRPFEGSIEVISVGGSTGFETLNLAPIEDYVEGVVPAESPASWGVDGEAALQAQAVAARSYAIAYTSGGKGTICDTTDCQVYGGDPNVAGDYSNSSDVRYSDEATTSTAGEVRVFSGPDAGGPSGAVALTEYSSSTGGYTAGGTFPAVVDAGDATPSNPNHSWTAQIPTSAVQRAFPSLGTIESIVITERNGLGDLGGRVLQMVIAGSSGRVTTTGSDFADALALRSDWFTFTNLPTSGGGDDGYWVLGAGGGVFPFGGADNYGSLAGVALKSPVVGLAPTPDGGGYWLVASDGGIFTFGDAHYYGSTGNIHLNQPIVGMASTPDGKGYWLVASDGGIFTFGDAHYYGSTGNIHLNQPIVGMASTPDGKGYWLVASDGGIFTFGDAHYYGSTGNIHLNKPIVAMAPAGSGGYWLFASDGGVFTFGDARYEGSLPGMDISATVSSVAPTADGAGYLVLATSGQVYPFGDAPYVGDPASTISGWLTSSGPARGIFMHRVV